MIINSITLENFKSHKHTHITLENGISLILGSNGAGKSSIFEAISYAFFKTFNGKIDDVIRKARDEEDIVKKMKVTIEFKNNSIQYKLIRGKEKSKSIAQLYHKINDKYRILCKGDQNVTNEIESILGLDSKSFLNAIYIRQGDITELIEKTASERKEFMAKLLNIDDVQKAWEEMKNIIDKYKEKANKYEGRIEGKVELEENISNINENIKKNEVELNNLTPSQESLEKELKDLEIKVKEVELIKSEYNRFNNELIHQNRFIETLKEQKENNDNELKNIAEYERECKELQKFVDQLPHLEDLKDLKNKLDTYNKEYELVNSKIEDIEDNKRIIDENKVFFSEYSNIEEKIDELQNQRKVLEEQVKKDQEIKIKLNDRKNKKEENLVYIRKTSEKATKLFKINFNNPEEVESKCTEEYDKTKEIINMLSEKIIEKNNELSLKQNLLSSTKKSLEDLENTEDTCPICQSDIPHEKHLELSKKYSNDIVSFENRIEEIKNANKNQNEKLKNYEEYLKSIESINIEILKERYQEFNQCLDEIKKLNELLPEVEENDKKLGEIDLKINEEKINLKNLEQKRDLYKVASENLKKLPEIEKLSENRNEIYTKMREIKDESRAIMQKYAVRDDLDKTIEYVRKQVETYNINQGRIKNKETYLNDNENITHKINEEVINLNNINSKIKELNYDEENFKKINDTYTSNQEKLEKIKIEITSLTVNINKDKEQLERYKDDLKKIEKDSEELKHLKDYISVLEEIRNTYSKDEVQKELRELARPNIEQETMKIFSEFDFDYTSLKLDEDYNITVENKNEVLDLSMMSGGEKIAMALALRLGIARVVSKDKTELLLLDEPTIHLDEKRRADLIDTIGKISIVPQMIVVTHDDEMLALSNNIINIRKENGISSLDNS